MTLRLWIFYPHHSWRAAASFFFKETFPGEFPSDFQSFSTQCIHVTLPETLFCRKRSIFFLYFTKYSSTVLKK